ncbi:MAG: hypothetical protein KHW78_08530 [[Eubacterium] siraeum]|nr:hypothetical protein [[Eubacterium] siraeum]
MIIKAVGTPRGIRTLVIITQAFRIRRLKKEIIKRDTADEFCRQWYWREENKTQKQRQPQNKRKSLLSFLRSFL